MPDHYLALKGAFRDLVAAVGGNTRAATVSRVGASLISRYGAIHEGVHAPIDVILDLEQDCGSPIVTRLLAEHAGFDLVPRAAAAVDSDVMIGHLADVSREAGGLVADLGEALRDGRIDDLERARLLKKGKAAATEIAEAVADLERAPSSRAMSA